MFQERYLPCSVDWFLQRCHVRRYDEAQHKLIGPVLVPEGQVTQDKLTGKGQDRGMGNVAAMWRQARPSGARQAGRQASEVMKGKSKVGGV